jgi:hypothetical protein
MQEKKSAMLQSLEKIKNMGYLIFLGVIWYCEKIHEIQKDREKRTFYVIKKER